MFEPASAWLLGWPPALVASTLAALMASLGIVLVVTQQSWAEEYRPFFAALAAGVLLSTSIFLLSDVFEESRNGPLAVLAGYFSLFLIDRLVQRPEGRAFTAFFAIAAHSTIDGVQYGILFQHNMMAGAFGAVGLILHEFSEGIILFLIMRSVGIATGFAALLALIGTAVTTPMGTWVALSVIPTLSDDMLALGLGYAGGALLFVGASQLPSEFGKLRFRASLLTYMAGAVVGVLLMQVAHNHHHDSDKQQDTHRHTD